LHGLVREEVRRDDTMNNHTGWHQP